MDHQRARNGKFKGALQLIICVTMHFLDDEINLSLFSFTHQSVMHLNSCDDNFVQLC